MYQHYHKLLHEYDMHVGNSMMQCHLQDNCDKFKIKKTDKTAKEKLHVLYKEDDVYMLFKMNDAYMKSYISLEKYSAKRAEIFRHALMEYGLYILVLTFISVLFALYAIRPLKKALKLNEEFVKDILHDFNTPISSLTVNYKILKKHYGENEAIDRSEEAIKNILSLQNNLHFFLNQSKLQNESLNLKDIVDERVVYFKNIFSDIDFQTDIKEIYISTNKSAFIRILDNLISNAGKYNKKNGYVKIELKDNILSIKDSAIGIKNPDKIFQRYYKENERGLGIGLHVVKKLCDELHIKISLQSTLGEGSLFRLDISKIRLS
jgi:signal transduction histidine kinase